VCASGRLSLDPKMDPATPSGRQHRSQRGWCAPARRAVLENVDCAYRRSRSAPTKEAWATDLLSARRRRLLVDRHGAPRNWPLKIVIESTSAVWFPSPDGSHSKDEDDPILSGLRSLGGDQGGRAARVVPPGRTGGGAERQTRRPRSREREPTRLRYESNRSAASRCDDCFVYEKPHRLVRTHQRSRRARLGPRSRARGLRSRSS
jgi:hypothetical protein